jgi:hypothetical protein
MSLSMGAGAEGSRPLDRAPDSYSALKRAPTSRGGGADYSGAMNDGIYFADPNEPFHVWVRVRTADKGYRWVLREAMPSEPDGSPTISDREPSKDGKEGS